METYRCCTFGGNWYGISFLSLFLLKSLYYDKNINIYEFKSSKQKES